MFFLQKYWFTQYVSRFGIGEDLALFFDLFTIAQLQVHFVFLFVFSYSRYYNDIFPRDRSRSRERERDREREYRDRSREDRWASVLLTRVCLSVWFTCLRVPVITGSRFSDFPSSFLGVPWRFKYRFSFSFVNLDSRCLGNFLFLLEGTSVSDFLSRVVF